MSPYHPQSATSFQYEKLFQSNPWLVVNANFVLGLHSNFLKVFYLLIFDELITYAPLTTIHFLTEGSNDITKVLGYLAENFVMEKSALVLMCYLQVFKTIIQSSPASQRESGREYLWLNFFQPKQGTLRSLPNEQEKSMIIEAFTSFNNESFSGKQLEKGKVALNIKLEIPNFHIQTMKITARSTDTESELFNAICLKAKFEKETLTKESAKMPFGFYIVHNGMMIYVKPHLTLKAILSELDDEKMEGQNLEAVYCPKVKQLKKVYHIQMNGIGFATNKLMIELSNKEPIENALKTIREKLRVQNDEFGIAIKEIPQQFMIDEKTMRPCNDGDFTIETTNDGEKIYFLKLQNNFKNYQIKKDTRLFLRYHLHNVTVTISDEIKIKDEGSRTFSYKVTLNENPVNIIAAVYDYAQIVTPEKNSIVLCFKKEKEQQTMDTLSFTTLKKTGVEEGDTLILAKKIDSKDQDETEPQEESIWSTEEKPVYNEETHSYLPSTLNQLILYATNTEKLNQAFVSILASTYHSFTTDQKLIEKLKERCKCPDSISDDVKKKIIMKVSIFVKRWVDVETSTSTLNKLYDFLENFLAKESGFAKPVSMIQEVIIQKRSPTLSFSVKPPMPIMTHEGEFSLETIDPTELARQLTIAAYDIFKQVNASEFFHNGWTKPDCKVRSPHICELTDLFNKIAVFVSYSILSRQSLKERIDIMKRHVLVAQKLNTDFNNFHILLACVSGLNCSSISRLKFTRERLDKKTQLVLSELEQLTSMENSFKTMRDEFKARMPPCIPPLGMFLIDLTFIEDGNPDFLDGKINFEKRALYYKTLELLFRVSFIYFVCLFVHLFIAYFLVETICRL